MKRGLLFKYQLGLAGIGVFALVIVGLVLVQASATKHDAAVDKQANAAADKLNDYVTYNAAVPQSLSAAGYSQPAPDMSYAKLSDSKYRFCVTYKADSSDFDPGDVASTLATGGKLDTSTYDTGTNSYLIVASSHHKGKNCQTIDVGDSGYGGGGVSCGLLCGDSSDSGSTISSNGAMNSTSGTNNVTQGAADSKRQTDIGALQSYIEAAYANNNAYPTLSEINSSTWRAANMKGVDASAFCDPATTSTAACQLAASPQKGSYSYAPTDDDGQPCTASGDCQDYTLSATLSTGKLYQKTYL